MLLWSCSAFATPDDVTSAPGGCPFEDTDDIQGYIDAASDIMYQLTDGRVHGICTTTAFPMTNRACFAWDSDLRGSWWESGPTGGTIIHRNHWNPSLADQFGGHLPVRLRGPNVTVLDVTVDGAALAPSDWILVNGIYLIRKVGGWPPYNDITKPSGTGTWSITWSFGHAADRLTIDACVQLAIDIAKTSGIGESTGFGPGVTNVNLQGVQLSIEELAAQYATGSQKVAALDRFLGIYAAKGRDSADVYSPELDMWELQQVTFFS